MAVFQRARTLHTILQMGVCVCVRVCLLWFISTSVFAWLICTAQSAFVQTERQIDSYSLLVKENLIYLKKKKSPKNNQTIIT